MRIKDYGNVSYKLLSFKQLIRHATRLWLGQTSYFDLQCCLLLRRVFMKDRKGVYRGQITFTCSHSISLKILNSFQCIFVGIFELYIENCRKFNFDSYPSNGARGSVVGWEPMLQARRSRVRVPMGWIFKFTSSFQPHYGLGSTQPLTEVSTRKFRGR
jgi:hypothetical protein